MTYLIIFPGKEWLRGTTGQLDVPGSQRDPTRNSATNRVYKQDASQVMSRVNVTGNASLRETHYCKKNKSTK